MTSDAAIGEGGSEERLRSLGIVLPHYPNQANASVDATVPSRRRPTRSCPFSQTTSPVVNLSDPIVLVDGSGGTMLRIGAREWVS
jgi:hypothetical protein